MGRDNRANLQDWLAITGRGGRDGRLYGNGVRRADLSPVPQGENGYGRGTGGERGHDAGAGAGADGPDGGGASGGSHRGRTGHDEGDRATRRAAVDGNGAGGLPGGAAVCCAHVCPAAVDGGGNVLRHLQWVFGRRPYVRD